MLARVVSPVVTSLKPTLATLQFDSMPLARGRGEEFIVLEKELLLLFLLLLPSRLCCFPSVEMSERVVVVVVMVVLVMSLPKVVFALFRSWRC